VRGCVSALAAAGLLGLGAPATSTATPPKPSGNASTYKWLRAECKETDQGFRSFGSVKTWVNYLSAYDGDANSVYYQRVTVQIDRLAGFGNASNRWSKVDSKTYSWSRFTRREPLPTWSTTAIRSPLQPDEATLSVKATIRLKRVRKYRPDKTVWQYMVRSEPFTCLSDGEGTWG
jgi:hypothetical protein